MLVVVNLGGLNRTFYGIETRVNTLYSVHLSVLIVPFMELKQGAERVYQLLGDCLNRTFYGIET